MPTYDYRCEKCKHEMEVFQTMTAGPLRKCPKCGENRLKRLIGIGAGVVFKGSGFYQTDYRSEGYKKSAEAEKKSSEPAKTETKSETKSESATSKAETKSEKPKKSKPDKKSAA